MQKKAFLKVKGMQRDLSISSFNSEYAYEIKNMRIMALNNNTLFSLQNERGTKKYNINNIDNYIKGTPIGVSVIDNDIIIFSSGDKDYNTDSVDNLLYTTNNTISLLYNTDLINPLYSDKIYNISYDYDSGLTGSILYEGNLNFNTNYPIESLSLIEGENIKKIYWTDNLNQPRVLNIKSTNLVKSLWNDKSFNFVPSLRLRESVKVVKNHDSGVFSPGTIQYAFTYYNQYSQETNIFYITPLYYISPLNRGENSDNTVSNSFTISISNIDYNFQYLRIYSIQRTSIDATPIVKNITDLYIDSTSAKLDNDNYTISYTDTGLNGSTLTATDIFYIGCEDILAGTISQKDNTLFLGNITLNRNIISDTVKSFFNGKSLTFLNNRRYKNTTTNIYNYYPYESQLNSDNITYNSNDTNSQILRGLKYLETYRFGVQFQHYTGKWSEAIYINDLQNTVSPTGEFDKHTRLYLPSAYYDLTDSSIIKELISNGYIAVRPIIVTPSIYERDIICQGMICPTVFNFGDRSTNSPFVQSSWFLRPNSPFDIWNWADPNATNDNGWLDRNSTSGLKSINSRRGVTTTFSQTYDSTTYNSFNNGSWATFINHNTLGSDSRRNKEIQMSSGGSVYSHIADDYKMETAYSESFAVDQSIITLHSPDIEFDSSLQNIDLSSVKFRIVGMIPFTSNIGDINIITSTSQNTYKDNYSGTNKKILTPGFYKETIGSINFSRFGYRSLISGPFWMDEISDPADLYHNDRFVTGYIVYPWHRAGSLNNQNSSDDTISAKLKYKKLSNLKSSYNTAYLSVDKIWNSYIENSAYNTGISDVKIFNSDEVSNIKLKAPSNSGLQDINYYGNIDKILTFSNSLPSDLKSDGYDIVISGREDSLSTNDYQHKLFTNNWITVHSLNESLNYVTHSFKVNDPISIKYKSTPHAVISLNYTKTNKIVVLPSLFDIDYNNNQIIMNNANTDLSENTYYFWDKNKQITGVYQEALDTDIIGASTIAPANIEYGYLWMGELYRDNVVNKFGGTTQEAIENNNWIPSGPKVSLLDNNGVKSSIQLDWFEADTYYQRYDCLKTYPFTSEDVNSVVEIGSFMVETRINLDGRYDKNRGQLDNTTMTPTNFNLMNTVYNQSNNYFIYHGLNTDKDVENNFPNQITYTNTKNIGELTDTWTNVTLTSVLDLDGNNGNLNAIRKFNNELITFQDKGIANILFNSRTQISASEGVPIEIANSGKVDGKRYLSNVSGCQNKWSICETPSGIYYIDDISKSIYLFNGKLNEISDKLGFHSWINSKSKKINVWNPVDFDNFVTYFDKINGDVLFISKEDCLAFSEPLSGFSSFYSHENVPFIFSIKDKTFSLAKSINGSSYKLWEIGAGDYNNFYDKYNPFYITYIINPDITEDKIFDSIDFKSDTYNGDTLLDDKTFTNLYVWNEYQEGSQTLEYVLGKPSNLKKKFRVWRSFIPRDESNKLNRIRNPWIYLKLSSEEENTYNTILHDLTINYTI